MKKNLLTDMSNINNNDPRFIKNHVLPLISPHLSHKSIREEIIEFTKDFINKHHVELLDSGPINAFKFTEEDLSFLYTLLKIPDTRYGKIIKNINDPKIPVDTLLISIIIESLNKGYEDLLETAELLLIFNEYPHIFYKFWQKNIIIKEDIMNYTIDKLDSRFIIKREKNILGLLKYISHPVGEYYKCKIENETDDEYFQIKGHMVTHLNNIFRNVANKYYDNYNKLGGKL